jgi:hypothetical protein
MFTRRTATVIISAPDASCAFTMTDGDEYFPVPTMSRELKVLPAIENVSMWTVRGWLSATYEVHDFNLVALAHDDLVEGRALEDDQIVFDRYAPRIDRQLREQLAHGDRTGDLVRIAVQNDGQVKSF